MLCTCSNKWKNFPTRVELNGGLPIHGQVRTVDYVTTQMFYDRMRIERTISENAGRAFKKSGNLNELFADGAVRIRQGKLEDGRLQELIESVLYYDV